MPPNVRPRVVRHRKNGIPYGKQIGKVLYLLSQIIRKFDTENSNNSFSMLNFARFLFHCRFVGFVCRFCVVFFGLYKRFALTACNAGPQIPPNGGEALTAKNRIFVLPSRTLVSFLTENYTLQCMWFALRKTDTKGIFSGRNTAISLPCFNAAKSSNVVVISLCIYKFIPHIVCKTKKPIFGKPDRIRGLYNCKKKIQ